MQAKQEGDAPPQNLTKDHTKGKSKLFFQASQTVQILRAAVKICAKYLLSQQRMPFGCEMQCISKRRESSYCLYLCIMLLLHGRESLVCRAISLASSSHRKPCRSAYRREYFLLLSIATRPNSCKTNPGINRVSEVDFTSDCIFLICQELSNCGTQTISKCCACLMLQLW